MTTKRVYGCYTDNEKTNPYFDYKEVSGYSTLIGV